MTHSPSRGQARRLFGAEQAAADVGQRRDATLIGFAFPFLAQAPECRVILEEPIDEARVIIADRDQLERRFPRPGY